MMGAAPRSVLMPEADAPGTGAVSYFFLWSPGLPVRVNRGFCVWHR